MASRTTKNRERERSKSDLSQLRVHNVVLSHVMCLCLTVLGKRKHDYRIQFIGLEDKCVS